MPPTVRHSATALSGALNALRERSSPPRCMHAVPRPRSARIYPDMHGGNDGTRPHPPCASVLNRISHRFLTLFPTPSVSPPHAYRSSSTRVRSGLAWKSWQSFQIGVNSLQSSRASKYYTMVRGNFGRVDFGHVRRIVRGESRKAGIA